jgi:hypothetical protein
MDKHERTFGEERGTSQWSFFQRIFENALQIVAPFFHAFFKTL